MARVYGPLQFHFYQNLDSANVEKGTMHMGKKQNYVAAGHISYNDIVDQQRTLYVNDIDDFYNLSGREAEYLINPVTKQKVVDPMTGKFKQRGKCVTQTARDALSSFLSDSYILPPSMPQFRRVFEFQKWLADTDANELFKTLMSLNGIGVSTACLMTCALKRQLPDVTAIMAHKWHNNLLVKIDEENLPYGVSVKDDTLNVSRIRPNAIDTRIPFWGEDRASAEIRERVKEAIQKDIDCLPLKRKPKASDVFDMAFNPPFCGSTVVFGDNSIMDASVYSAETRLFELCKTDWNLPSLGHLPETQPRTGVRTTDVMSAEQISAIERIMNSQTRVSVLTAGPGAGKTHVITQLYRQLKGSMYITTYMHKAANNLDERIPDYEFGGRPFVKTILSTEASLRNKVLLRELAQVKLLVVDESSVLSSALICSVLNILDKCDPHCRLLLVGDEGQLPPVKAYGLPFQKLVKNGLGTIVRLLEFHRSNATGVFELLKNIRRSEGILRITGNPIYDEVHPEGISIFGCTSQESAIQKTVEHVMADENNTIVVAETNAMCAAVNAAICQSKYGKIYFKHEGTSYESKEKLSPTVVGMRVVAVQNITEQNGLVVWPRNCFGTVVDSNAEFVVYHKEGAPEDRTFVYPREKAERDFEGSWCSTVHKYQGSESQRVVYIVDNQKNLSGNPFYQQKELKYVALSRTKKILNIIAIGDYRREERVGELTMKIHSLPDAVMAPIPKGLRVENV